MASSRSLRQLSIPLMDEQLVPITVSPRRPAHSYRGLLPEAMGSPGPRPPTSPLTPSGANAGVTAANAAAAGRLPPGGGVDLSALRNMAKVAKAFEWAAYDKRRLRMDRQLVGLAVLTLICQITSNALRWVHGRSDDGKYEHPDNFPQWLFITNEVLKVITSALTVGSIFILVRYYQLSIEHRKREYESLREGTGTVDDVGDIFQGRKSYLIANFIAEVFIHIVSVCSTFLTWFIPSLPSSHPRTYHSLELCVMLRVYQLFRLLHVSSSAFRHRTAIHKYFWQSLQMNWHVRWKVTLKMHFYEHSVGMLCLSVVTTLFLAALGIFLLEGDVTAGNNLQTTEFSNLGSCLWFVFVTFTTIGYGDMAPTTAPGRVLTVMLGITSQCILAVFGGVITNKLAPSRQQQFIGSYLNRRKGIQEERKAAATVIQAAWRARLNYCASPEASAMAPGSPRASSPRGAGSPRNKDKRPVKVKGTKVRLAIKRFRCKRCDRLEASLQCNDPVLEQKINALQEDIASVLLILERTGAQNQDSNDGNAPLRRRMFSLAGSPPTQRDRPAGEKSARDGALQVPSGRPPPPLGPLPGAEPSQPHPSGNGLALPAPAATGNGSVAPPAAAKPQQFLLPHADAEVPNLQFSLRTDTSSRGSLDVSGAKPPRLHLPSQRFKRRDTATRRKSSVPRDERPPPRRSATGGDNGSDTLAVQSPRHGAHSPRHGPPAAGRGTLPNPFVQPAGAGAPASTPGVGGPLPPPGVGGRAPTPGGSGPIPTPANASSSGGGASPGPSPPAASAQHSAGRGERFTFADIANVGLPGAEQSARENVWVSARAVPAQSRTPELNGGLDPSQANGTPGAAPLTGGRHTPRRASGPGRGTGAGTDSSQPMQTPSERQLHTPASLRRETPSPTRSPPFPYDPAPAPPLDPPDACVRRDH
eukprot:TRINITY_DN18708_c0_g1_i1.p1 TRINITY_DN18708_c0_g1~~TRINITY_DN18708_c0_g1_i1.p1  ORF type:complete len:927 (+),score=138.82 TRINITY_DN18708_c0_g1_i1:115-2895(+)